MTRNGTQPLLNLNRRPARRSLPDQSDERFASAKLYLRTLRAGQTKKTVQINLTYLDVGPGTSIKSCYDILGPIIPCGVWGRGGWGAGLGKMPVQVLEM